MYPGVSEDSLTTSGKPSTRLPPGRLAEQEPMPMKRPLRCDSTGCCSQADLSQKARHVSHCGLMSHFVRQKNFETTSFGIRNHRLETACIFSGPSKSIGPRKISFIQNECADPEL